MKAVYKHRSYAERIDLACRRAGRLSAAYPPGDFSVMSDSGEFNRSAAYRAFDRGLDDLCVRYGIQRDALDYELAAYAGAA